MAIPATDLAINSFKVFERVWRDKGHDCNGSDTLVFWGWLPFGLCKKEFLLFLFCHNYIITQNDSTKQDYNPEEVVSQYISKYMALKVCCLKYFEQCILQNPASWTFVPAQLASMYQILATVEGLSSVNVTSVVICPLWLCVELTFYESVKRLQAIS